MKVALLRDQNPDLWGCPFLVDVEQPQMNLSIVFGLCNALMSIACNIDIIFLTAILSLSSRYVTLFISSNVRTLAIPTWMFVLLCHHFTSVFPLERIDAIPDICF